MSFLYGPERSGGVGPGRVDEVEGAVPEGTCVLTSYTRLGYGVMGWSGSLGTRVSRETEEIGTFL